jgi:cytochrome oxidase Cu insertion factor (SCO1/SenC/PrrC family)
MRLSLTLLLLVMLAFTGKGQNSNKKTIIKIIYPEFKAGDSLVVYRSGEQKPSFHGEIFDYEAYKPSAKINGVFEFRLSNKKLILDRYAFLSVKLFRKIDSTKNSAADDNYDELTLLPYNLSELDDELTLYVANRSVLAAGRGYMHNFKITFSGRGSSKFSVRRQIDSISYYSQVGNILSKDGKYIDSNYLVKNVERCLKFLAPTRKYFNDFVYNWLKGYAVYSNRKVEALLLAHYIKKFPYTTGKPVYSQLLNAYQDQLRPSKYAISDRQLYWCNDYIEALINKETLVDQLKTGLTDYDNVYKQLAELPDGILKDKAITQFLLVRVVKLKDQDQVLSDALAGVKEPVFRTIIQSLYARTTGRVAYNFALQDTAGKIVKLDNFKGKIVLIDFWFTGCSSCSRFYKQELSKAEEHYKRNPKVAFISVSIDGSKTRWLKSVRSGEYTSGEITNLYTNGEGMQNEVIKHYRIGSFPQPLLLDSRHVIKSANTSLRSKEGIIKQVDLLLNETVR